jgi:PAS domain S-box-containing protein
MTDHPNADLINRIEDRQDNKLLRRKVNAAFALAFLLTVLLSSLSWRTSRRAAEDADWVAHTHEVSTALEVALRHLVDVETGARGFAMTGHEVFLEPYETGKYAVSQDLAELNVLMVDDGQKLPLTTLVEQTNAGIVADSDLVAIRRNSGTVPSVAQLEHGKNLMDALRVTVDAMEIEEKRLLEQRTNRARAARRLATSAIWVGSVLGMFFLFIATIAVNREISVNTRARAHVNALNTDLERRVEQSERLSAVIDSSEDAVIAKDLNGKIGAWNRGAEKVFGYSASEAMGKSMLMLLPPERVNEESDILERIRRGESVEHFETTRVRKDGTIISISATISPIKDSGGTIVGASKIARDITEQKSAEEALRQSEERFRDMLNGIPQLAWMADADGKIFWYNERWYEYTGTTSEQMAGLGWQSVHDPEFLPKVLEKWEASIAEGAALEMEFPLRAADGRFGTFLTRIVPLKDADGRVVRWFGTNTDISERARAEQRLVELARELSHRAEELASSRESLEAQTAMFKLVLASMGEGLIAADLEGHFLIFNDAAHDLMGRGPEDLPTEQWTSHYKVLLPDGITPFPPDRLPLVRALHGESVQVELIVQSSEVRCMDVTARPLKDARGNLCGGVAVLRDITERKQSEVELAQKAQELFRSRQALETQTLMLRSVLDSMVEGLVAADENGKFILWNPAAEKIVGLSAANVPPEEWSAHYCTYLPDMVTLFPPEQNPLLRAIRGEVSTALMFLRNPEINRAAWIESNGAPLRDKDGVVRGGVVAFRDITQRKADELEIWKLNEHLEQRIAERTAQLEAANKELEAFSYSVAHDLRAPLRHIDGFSKILAEHLGGSLDKNAQHYLESIQDSTRNMGDMVDEMLNLSRVARMELNLRVTGLSSLVEEVLKDLEPELKDRDIEWKIAGLPFVECDPILAKQVFVNLLSNAVKFSRTRPHAIIEVGQKDVDGQSAIYVRDNGVGFNMKYSNKLFGVFQRLHRQEDFEGTGVGLATVQRIVQKHGGRVWAEAELNTGATFYFTLGTAVQTAGLIKELSYEGR